MNIKIVKEFEDNGFYAKRYEVNFGQGTWRWGLSDKGELCFMGSGDNEWQTFRGGDNRFTHSKIDIPTMQKIVNQFAHLLPLL